MRRILTVLLIAVFPLCLRAQVGEYRNIFAMGVNGGYMFTSVGFSPKVTQKKLNCVTGGLSFRYTSEKYFTALCSITGEINWSQMGWNEDILTINSQPVVNAETGLAEQYRRRLTYIQVPIMAHLAWGAEEKGFSFFFQAGPQFGYMLSESTDANFNLASPNLADRANSTVAQYDMPVENKFDYGICAGLGVEYSHPAVGHFRLEARYYFGLGNIYGSSKSDYFGKSNQAAIEVKLAYMVDVNKRSSRR
ncbi:MAG: PorT family protein [Prevotella sp.]|nr:PorT family protein [Prevotella sp.]